MNPALNKQLHGLLTSTGLGLQKAALVSSYTHGRSESSKDLSNEEAKQMIAYLARVANDHGEASQKMRRSIISMAHEMHWHLPGTQKIDMERLNDWCCVYGFGKKVLNRYSYVELTKLVTQFKIIYNSYISNLKSPKK